MDLHIRDSNFFSEKYPERPNPYINWIWDRVLQHNDITVFSDCHLREALYNSSTVKIAYLIEPPVINMDAYEFVKKNIGIFKYVFTFVEDMRNFSDNIVVFPHGTSWVSEGDRKVYFKTKMTSIIASGKNWTEGHKLRHAAISAHRDRMDVMGNGYREIPSKLEGLIPYRYQVVIENSKLDLYFTEKFMDCIFTGVVPIYWGCPGVINLFDPNGIITFDKVEHLDDIFRGISEEDYNSRLPAIEFNLKKAEEYHHMEKHLYAFLRDKI